MCAIVKLTNLVLHLFMCNYFTYEKTKGLVAALSDNVALKCHGAGTKLSSSLL